MSLNTPNGESRMPTLSLPMARITALDRKSTRLNSSYTVIYTLSLHDALPICVVRFHRRIRRHVVEHSEWGKPNAHLVLADGPDHRPRSEEHTSELQLHSDLHSFPTRRSSDLCSPLPSPHKEACR